MNVNSVINIVIRLVMRKLIGRGINAGIGAISRRGADRTAGAAGSQDRSDAPPESTQNSRAAAKRAKQAMRLARRSGRF